MVYIAAIKGMARDFVDACAMWANAFSVAVAETAKIADGVPANDGKDGGFSL